MTVLGLAALVAGALAVSGAGDDGSGTRYKIVFDNASGLVEMADFRVGGVPVGQIEGFDVARDARAVVEVSVSDEGFGGLREDARCKILQQSLIGEYFVECEPGQGSELRSGGTVPVEQTESPIAFDVVQNILRRPYRERLSILLSELGAGFAARGEDVNATIRRALPALQETNRVLDILGDNRRTLRRLAADSGRILDELGDRREDVGRFVEEARDTAVATAQRRDALAATFRRFPGFLRELEPTMAALGAAARAQAPALADLRAAAPSFTDLLETLGPFARASRPAVESLGEAGRDGRRAAEEAASTVGELARLGRRSPDPANNLALILEHLDDREFAAEPDPDSPGGKGYTGLEAILQYPFDQSLAINIFDTRGYILKLNALINECSGYTDAEEAKAEPERYARCNSGLGPNQPGVTTPDPTADGEPERGPERGGERRTRRGAGEPGPRDERPDTGGADGRPEPPRLPDLDLLDRLPDLLEGRRPGLLDGRRPVLAQPKGAPVDLIDFLMAP